MRTIDEIDAKILHDLLRDGRKDFSDIACEIGISRNAVQKRYGEMKREGIIVGATTQVERRHQGFQAFTEFLLADYYIDSDLMHERLKNQAHRFQAIFNHPDKGDIEVFVAMRNLSEIEELKMLLAKLTAGRLRSYIWTGAVKSIPWNLSFGIFAGLKDNVCKKQSLSTSGTCRSELDEIDTQIIDKLSQNSRVPFSTIAKEIGVATDTVIRRYRELKKSGTINTLIQINPKKLGYTCQMETRIRLKSTRDSIEAMNILAQVPDIYFMTATSGDYDLHLFAFVRDIEHFLAIQKNIVDLPDFGKLDMRLTGISECIFPFRQYWSSTI